MDLHVTVLYALPYRMVDEKSGEVTNSGISVYAYEKDHFKPCEKKKGSNTAKGCKPIKFNLPIELERKITQVPAVYSIEVDMESNKDLKAELRIIDLEFVGLLETKVTTPQPVAR